MMYDAHISKIALELKLAPQRVAATVSLLDDAATVPFIARYRKEMTGSLDEVLITTIRDRVAQLRELDKRREAILASLEERGLLTDELREKLTAAATMAALEDIYLPFRPKRRTRATIARERGLEPLAELLFAQDDIDPIAEAAAFVNPEKEVLTADEALAGARDIIAEWVSEDSSARARMRELYGQKGMIRSTVSAGKETEGIKFSDYFDWQEPLAAAPSHRVLAIRRGEAEGVLTVHIAPPEEEALVVLDQMFVIGDYASSAQVRLAVHDSYQRLLGPSMENEIRADAKQRADEEAIRVFAANLRELLMAPPLGQKRVMAVDPGFRTGCKVACLDRQGQLLHHVAIYPHGSSGERDNAGAEIEHLCREHAIDVIAVGNGTAGRETEAFLRELQLPPGVLIEMVNESGASVYSASEVAREEFPEHDVTVRGAISIGRRLMDPLAELVKIDPRSIGVGQYQHDVDQGSLRQGLDDVVISCVNAVGVEVNTASKQLLTYVSGLGPHLAANIVTFRDTNGPFRSRDDFLQVPRLGPKAFEQAAGFLRIAGAMNPLDTSAVHPESYGVVTAMAADLGCTIGDLIREETIRTRIPLHRYVSARAGMPTLKDIIDELAKPGRDPRREFAPFSFDPTVKTIEDVRAGMVLPGIITNVTRFGAFVDLGVHQEGLVHISELADRFVKDPGEVVRVRQRVMAKVLAVDLDRGRISLSLRQKRPTA
jgi:uncharacterized protein